MGEFYHHYHMFMLISMGVVHMKICFCAHEGIELLQLNGFRIFFQPIGQKNK